MAKLPHFQFLWWTHTIETTSLRERRYFCIFLPLTQFLCICLSFRRLFGQHQPWVLHCGNKVQRRMVIRKHGCRLTIPARPWLLLLSDHSGMLLHRRGDKAKHPVTEWVKMSSLSPSLSLSLSLSLSISVSVGMCIYCPYSLPQRHT